MRLCQIIYIIYTVIFEILLQSIKYNVRYILWAVLIITEDSETKNLTTEDSTSTTAVADADAAK